MVDFSVRCRCTDASHHAVSHLSAMYDFYLEWSDRYFYELHQIGKNIKFVFYIHKTLKCFRSFIPASYNYHKDK